MNTKEDVLQHIKILAEQKIITKDEIDAAFDSVSKKNPSIISAKKFGIAEILYYIGAAIVFLGIVILLVQNWYTLSFVTKVLATLGVGVATYFAGVLFERGERTETISSAFYLISALVMPTGLYVVFKNAGFDASSYGFLSLISGILFAVYFLSYVVFRKNIFVLFSILFGTWFFLSITSFMVSSSTQYFGEKFIEYRILIVGISYMLFGYVFSKNKHTRLHGFFYGFGILGFLSAALALGGWEPNQNIFWELIYPALVFGALFLSVYLKSKALLMWGTLFLMAYILKITSEYFSRGLGWPLALVIAGLAMIGAGYLYLSLKNKYLYVVE